MKNRIYSLAILLACTGLGACTMSEDGRTVAKVNGKSISLSEFEVRLQEYRVGSDTGLQPSPQDTSLKKRVLNEMIEEMVLLEEAERKSLTIEPKDLEDRLAIIKGDYPAGAFEKMLAQEKITLARFRDRLKTTLLLEKVVEEITRGIPQPSPADIELYYHEHKDDFTHQGRVHLKQIVVKTEEDGKRILEELKKEVPFEVLARNHSFTPEATEGGDMGWIASDVLPQPIQDQLAKLKLGQVSDVIPTDYGFHIIMLLEKKEPHELTLEEATSLIVPILTRKDREEKFAAWRQSVLAQAKIERNHELLAKAN